MRDAEKGGWHLTPGQRIRVVQGRTMIQPPGPDDAATVLANARDMSRTGTGTGISSDVLMTLESLRQLAEQGNLAARWLYDRERARLGISMPSITES